MKYYIHPERFEDKKIGELDEMVNRYTNSKDISHISHSIVKIDKSIDNKDNKEKWCVENAYRILSKYYSITKECKLFEIWKYNLDGERTVESPLAIHKDNDNVHTFILYTRKDSGIHGGNLIIYKDEGGCITSVIRPTSGTIVCMDGNTYHRPEMMSGIGVRSCIVIQFAKIM